jgi:hypothetical protein
MEIPDFLVNVATYCHATGTIHELSNIRHE